MLDEHPQFRDARHADAPALATVQIAAWRAAYPGLVPDDYLATMDPTEFTARWERFLSIPTSRTLVADDAAGVCAYCSLGPSRDADNAARSIGEIFAVYVHPRGWRRGIGRLLCTRAITLLRTAGSAAVTLWVAEQNVPAQAFYAALGFSDDGGRKIETAGAPIRHRSYRLALTAPDAATAANPRHPEATP